MYIPTYNDDNNYVWINSGELYEVSDPALSYLDEFEEHPVEYFRTMIQIRDLELRKQTIDKNIPGYLLVEKYDQSCPEESIQQKAVENTEVFVNDLVDTNIYLLRNEERIQTYRKEFDSKFVIVNDGDWKKHLNSI
jgi:gamma-glutamylcyclotransferase (GGCT)/AIG2-like uncharacterized protein YtfP